MFQVLQNIKSGKLSLEEVPIPSPQEGFVLVKTHASLISAGTEKMLIDLAQKSLVGKAQARPDLVKQILNKAKKEGWLNTFQNVMSKMEKPIPLGYSAAGVVTLSSVEGSLPTADCRLPTGTRVAIAGAGYANHAEINNVPVNLMATIPDNVSFEEAAYTTVASIALQGVRLAKPELGEYVVVSGLGLIGLITVQLLKSNGCKVAGLDFDQSKIDLALSLGLDLGINLSKDDALKNIEHFTGGRLADYTIITAAAKSNQPIELAGEITRRKGQVVVVGSVGMDIPRDVYYKKELEVKISMSYGPGRYDTSYEEGGIDYPYDYVRWTEQRNMEAVLNLISQGKLNVKALTTHKFKFGEALKAYEMIQEQKEPYVGIILEYDVEKEHENVIHLKPTTHHPQPSTKLLTIGFVGAGNYASLHLLPHLKNNKHVKLKGLVTSTGLNAKQKAEKFGFEFCSTDYDSLLNNADINSVFIATRHSTHADYTIKALSAGKNVFVEKPMVISEEELDLLTKTYMESLSRKKIGLMVGLNRRFAPMTQFIGSNLEKNIPKQMMYRVNSGFIPTSTWLHQKNEGGGMLVGEMCHFIDLLMYLCKEKPKKVFASSLRLNNNNFDDADNVTITIEFESGSTGVLCYNTVGDKSASKERLEIYAGGKVIVLDDFRSVEIISNSRRTSKKASNQDKGQKEQIRETVNSFMKNESPIPFEDLVNVMKTIFAAKKSLSSGLPELINPLIIREI